MRAVLVCVAVLGGAGCYTNAFSNAAKAKEIQRKSLAKALPAHLEVATPVPGTSRTASVRVWVDDDFRSQNVRWRAQIEEQLDEANQLLAPAVGIRLVAKDMQPWPARSADRPLGEVLAALEAKDPGDDVDWVIGYASSLTLVEGSFEQLGMARPLGRHLVVRGYADVVERAGFERAFPDTTAEERERVHQARRRHKQTVVLLHELAHTLGAPHESDPVWLLATVYSPEMATLSEPCRAIMQLGLETWLVPRASFDVRALAARLNGYFETNPWGGWIADDKGALQAELRVMLESGGGGPAAQLGGEALEQLTRARRLAQAGKLADALAELEALSAAYPATGDVRQAICEVRIGKDGAAAEATAKACARVLEVAPDDPRPLFAMAGGFLAANDRAAALRYLAQVDGLAGERVDVWLTLAQIYMSQGLVTLAERAADRAEAVTAGAADEVRVWASRTRGRYGLPPGGAPGGIALADEGDYVNAVRELLAAIYADKFAVAKQQAAAAGKRWKGAPGLLAARCDLALRQQQLGAARALCDQAIAAWSGAAWALYLRGVLLVGAGKVQPAIASLRAAIAAEPELAQAYRTLAKALDRAGDAVGRAELAAAYAQRFGAKLP
ncbi:MAG: hypothetical protein IPL61_14280 [Myxococcales bacterium]|nr:hypothetical protein [Myxococcales bacterium]